MRVHTPDRYRTEPVHVFFVTAALAHWRARGIQCHDVTWAKLLPRYVYIHLRVEAELREFLLSVGPKSTCSQISLEIVGFAWAGVGIGLKICHDVGSGSASGVSSDSLLASQFCAPFICLRRNCTWRDFPLMCMYIPCSCWLAFWGTMEGSCVQCIPFGCQAWHPSSCFIDQRIYSTMYTYHSSGEYLGRWLIWHLPRYTSNGGTRA